MNLETSDLDSALGMVEMKIHEREKYDTDEDYFKAEYGVDLQRLADVFSAFVCNEFTLDSAFFAATFLYEVGRNQEQVINDLPTG